MRAPGRINSGLCETGQVQRREDPLTKRERAELILLQDVEKFEPGGALDVADREL